MKKIIFILFGFFLVFSSCKKAGFLDNKAGTALDENLVFSDSARTMDFLARIYQDAGFSFFKGRWDSHGNTEVATDDAEYAFSGVAQKGVILYNGTLSPLNFPFGEFWTTPYTNVRRVNLLLAKLPTTPLSADLQKRIRGEIKFLRAWYYHELLIAFGGIPLIGDNVYGINDLINIPRSSYEDCVNYVVKELDEAAPLLPEIQVPAPTGWIENDGYSEENYGRVTRGACMALKSRMLLYAASPLFNGGSTATSEELKKLVSYPVYNVNHWQAAAQAALDVINSGYYELHTVPGNTTPGYGFFDVFLKRVNREYIFAFNRGPNKDMEGYYNPPSRGGAKNTQATQNIVDAFPMKNGKAITDATSGYDPNNPYVNRDPRFEYSIIYNGSLYFSSTTNNKAPVNTYFQAPSDGFPATTTGYYTRKMSNDNVAANSGANQERGWPLIRYAEMLLNYAEAITEAGQPELAYPKLVEIRSRAGINPGADNLYGLKPNMTVSEMREVVRNERRIELAFEDHRWHDIRRWKIAMVTNNGYNKVMKIIKTGNVLSYNIIDSDRKHNFRPEMYLLPIPDGEIRKMPAMVQNPGW